MKFFSKNRQATTEQPALLGKVVQVEIYKGQDVSSGHVYALKHLLLQGDPERVQEVQREAKTMARLRGHPHILRLHAVAFAGPKGAETAGFFVMDLCPNTLINAMTQCGFQLTDAQVVEIFSDVCQGVAHMHRQAPPMAHRDLKCENVLQLADGSWVLCDFGSATTRAKVYETAAEMAEEEEEIRRHTTPAYRAPEMWDLYGRQRIDTRVDIWALGVLLYVLSYGRLPFQGDSKLQILNGKYDMPALPVRPHAIRALISDMLLLDPSARPDVEAVLSRVDELRAALRLKRMPSHAAAPTAGLQGGSGGGVTSSTPSSSAGGGGGRERSAQGSPPRRSQADAAAGVAAAAATAVAATAAAAAAAPPAAAPAAQAGAPSGKREPPPPPPHAYHASSSSGSSGRSSAPHAASSAAAADGFPEGSAEWASFPSPKGAATATPPDAPRVSPQRTSAPAKLAPPPPVVNAAPWQPPQPQNVRSQQQQHQQQQQQQQQQRQLSGAADAQAARANGVDGAAPAPAARQAGMPAPIARPAANTAAHPTASHSTPQPQVGTHSALPRGVVSAAAPSAATVEVLQRQVQAMSAQMDSLKDDNQAFVFRIKQLEEEVLQQRESLQRLGTQVRDLQASASAAAGLTPVGTRAAAAMPGGVAAAPDAALRSSRVPAAASSVDALSAGRASLPARSGSEGVARTPAGAEGATTVVDAGALSVQPQAGSSSAGAGSFWSSYN